ncbi:hypothetical protein [Chryseobacterium gambrini]|uniref:DUF4365 domain-containing protein n=1 Tax=Chryseobacterium gambrini TaxID=373672 RepID=A0ABN7CIV1_9FLAO|nr:hypothetical protein CRDW_37060 [Chryseobacterium gambrini]
MSRSADYTIQGFIYQFIITFHELLLSSENTEITIEGIVEDIDVNTPTEQIVIQCKYHESKQKFTLSNIYKPVLQMLCHYKNNPTKNINYWLHAHFPNETVGSEKILTKTELETILDSKATDLQKYIAQLSSFTQGDEFLKRFKVKFGATLSDTEKAVIVCLASEGFTTEDATEIFYPNAIHAIAELSIQHDEQKRKIKKADFLNELKKKKKTAISRWTKELQDYTKFLKQRRKQIGEILNGNSRKRAIILDANYIVDFERNIPILIQDYVAKYNSKIRLNQTPVFSLVCDEDMLNNIWKSLDQKKLNIERGMIANTFNTTRFLRDPLKVIKDGIIEFKLKLCNHENEFDSIVNEAGFDDAIIISDRNFPFEDTTSCNIEKLKTQEINEIKYLLSLTSTL